MKKKTFWSGARSKFQGLRSIFRVWGLAVSQERRISSWQCSQWSIKSRWRQVYSRSFYNIIAQLWKWDLSQTVVRPPPWDLCEGLCEAGTAGQRSVVVGWLVGVVAVRSWSCFTPLTTTTDSQSGQRCQCDRLIWDSNKHQLSSIEETNTGWSLLF